VFTREVFGVREPGSWFPHLLAQASPLAAALAIRLLGLFSRRVQVRDMSERWLAQHAQDAAKRADDP
jgi:hypothetical protein